MGMQADDDTASEKRVSFSSICARRSAPLSGRGWAVSVIHSDAFASRIILGVK